MAQGDYMQAGVYVPIRNHKFERFIRTVYFEVDTAAGSTDIKIADIDGNPLDIRAAPYCLVPGNIIKIGPNADGYFEERTITLIDADGASYFIRVAPLTYSYEAGDAVQAQSVPLEWTPAYGSYVDSRLYSKATAMPYGSGINTFQVGNAASVARVASGGENHRIQQYGDIGTLLNANGEHRLSAWGKGTGDNARCKVYLDQCYADKSDVGITSTSIDFENDTDWTLNSTTFTPNIATSLGLITVQIDSGITEATTFLVDNVILEHSVYTFTEYADLGTLRILDPLSDRQQFKRLNNTAGFSNSANGKYRQGFSMQFTDVPQVFRDNMRILHNYCEQGNFLVIRPNIDDLPDVMVCDMQISGQGKDFWSLPYGSISATFIEMM